MRFSQLQFEQFAAQLGIVDNACPVNWDHPLNLSRKSWLKTVGNPGWVLHDLCNKGNDGKLSGSTIPKLAGNKGRAGGIKSLSYNGSTAYVQTANALGLSASTAFSLACWVYAAANNGQFICSGINSSPFDGIWLGITSGGSVELQLIDTSTSQLNATTTATLTLNKWYRVLVTYNGANANASLNIVLYLNGEPAAASFSGTSPIGAITNRAFRLGAPVSGSGFFNGFMDDSSIWTRVLSAADVMQDYILSKQGYPGVLNFLPWFGDEWGVTATAASFVEAVFPSLAPNVGRRIFTPPTEQLVVLTGIQFDQAGNSGIKTANSNYTFTRTCNGFNGFLTVDVELLSANATVTSVTDDDGGGNIPMVFIGAQNVAGGTGRVECWGLVAPATGTKTIRVQLSSAITSVADAVSYVNVNQSIPFEAFNSNSGIATGTTASVVITPISDKTWIHAALVTNTTSGVVAGQNSRNVVTDGVTGTGADEDSGPITPASGQTMTFTVGAVQAWAVAGYALRPLSAAGLGYVESLSPADQHNQRMIPMAY